LVSLFQNGYWRRTAKQSVNQASVNQKDIKSVPFSYPSLPEQQRIVAKLEAAFAEIEDFQETIKKKSILLRRLKETFLRQELKNNSLNVK